MIGRMLSLWLFALLVIAWLSSSIKLILIWQQAPSPLVLQLLQESFFCASTKIQERWCCSQAPLAFWRRLIMNKHSPPHLHYVNKPHKSLKNELLLSIRHEMFAAVWEEEIACRLSRKVCRQFPCARFWNKGRVLFALYFYSFGNKSCVVMSEY